MTHQEKRWLVFGIVAGMLIAAIALGILLPLGIALAVLIG